MNLVEIVVLGLILLFALRYLWKYARSALGLGKHGDSSACPGCGEGDSCPSNKSVRLNSKR